MAHIPDGVLSAPVLIGGALASTALLSVALRRLDFERIPQAAVLAAAFFIASLITVPAGPSSVHLMLGGLMGVLLGWTAVPTVLIALLLQAIFFGYGGLLVLGVNCLNIALPALLTGLLLSARLRRARGRSALLWGAACGALATLLTGLMVSLSLAFSSQDFLPAAKIILLTYLPLTLAEAAVSAFALTFLARVAPEQLVVSARHG